MIVADPPTQPTPPPTTMRLVYCHKCRRPIGRVLLTPGSVVEFKCRSCGEKHLEVGT